MTVPLTPRPDVATGPEVLDALARELWEAYATYNQQVINFPTLHWDQLDPFTQDHWRHIARTALAFRPGPGG